MIELQFWQQELKNFDGRYTCHSLSALCVVYTDAYDEGYGGFAVEHGCHTVHGQWPPDEGEQSYTWNELCVVRLVLESIVSKLANK